MTTLTGGTGLAAHVALVAAPWQWAFGCTLAAVGMGSYSRL